MEQEAPFTADELLHRSHVERSIRELQRMVADSEDALAELRNRARPLPGSVTASLAAMRAGYDRATEAEPFLPFADSVLPALLALRKTHQVAVESRAYAVAQGEPLLAAARRRLAAEKTRLDDQAALGRALEARLAAIRSKQTTEGEANTTPAQRRQEKLGALAARKRSYDAATSALLRALRGFIHGRLGPMLAAEELGGPVVGAMADVGPDDLAAGFSAQGKPRQRSRLLAAKDSSAGESRDTRRQQRIDEIWGPAGKKSGNDSDSGSDSDNDNDDNNERDGRARNARNDESTAAGEEMQDLTEQLLNALAAAGGDGSASYVTLQRESAAVRFLVRSKAAQFHPRDATRLRLVDFGRELDD